MENLELNQVQDETLNDESLFDDSTEDTSDEFDFFDDTQVEEEKEDTSVEETKEIQEESKEELPFLEIKYNKETKGLTQEQARELAQKGMNYDHINEKYNSLNEALSKLARMNDMDVNSFLNTLNDTQVKFEEQKELDTLKEKYPDSNEELLKELASKNVKDRMAESLHKYEAEQNEQVNAHEQQAKRDIEILQKEFPDLKEIPEDVFNIIQNEQIDLVHAYYKYLHNEDLKRISEAEQRSKVDAMNETNKKKSLGSTSNAGDDEGKDDFFIGLNSI